MPSSSFMLLVTAVSQWAYLTPMHVYMQVWNEAVVHSSLLPTASQKGSIFVNYIVTQYCRVALLLPNNLESSSENSRTQLVSNRNYLYIWSEWFYLLVLLFLVLGSILFGDIPENFTCFVHKVEGFKPAWNEAGRNHVHCNNHAFLSLLR